MFSAIGNQSDIENLRVSAINLAHQEGFERSPDDVTVQRLVGFALSPALKKAFGDQLTIPLVVRALFAEMGRTESGDVFVTLNYDGEFRQYKDVAVIAGTQIAEDRMLERLGEPDGRWTREDALRRALLAWAVGARSALQAHVDEPAGAHDPLDPLRDLDEPDADRVFLHDELKTGVLAVGILERRGNRESRFRMLSEAETAAVLRSAG
jgi:proteasome alpha subunit